MIVFGGRRVKARAVFILAFVPIFFSNPANAQGHKLNYDQLRRPQDAVFYHVPIGLCEDYPEETTTLEIIRKDMELLRRAGINLLRISFGWDGIEIERDKYTWGFWDDFVKIAAEENGITLIPYICYTPKWNAAGDTANFWNHPPKDYEQFGEFVGDLVLRYKPWIKSWEIWNEPDIPAYWSGTVEDYSKLLKIGSAAVRKADPSAIVVCGGLAWNTNFLASLFRDYGVSPYLDVVNIHNYFETWNSSPIESIVGYVNTVSDIIRRYGNHQSIWVAEVGYSTFRKNGHVSHHYTAYYDYEHTPKYQAVHLFRALTLMLSTEKVAAIAWYEVKDLPSQGPVIGDVNNRHLGVAYVDYAPKPAEKALSFFNRLFSRRIKCIDRQVVVRRTLASESEVHAFEDENGSVIVVGWLKTHIPGKRGGDHWGTVRDTRKEVVELILPSKVTDRSIVYDELGNWSEFKSIEQKGQTTVLKDVALIGGEISIIKISKPSAE